MITVNLKTYFIIHYYLFFGTFFCIINKMIVFKLVFIFECKIAVTKYGKKI